PSAAAAPTAPPVQPPNPDIDWFTAATGPSGSAELWDLPTTQAVPPPFDAAPTYASPEPPIEFEAPPPVGASASFDAAALALTEPAPPTVAPPQAETPAVEQPAAPAYGDVSHLLAEHAAAAVAIPAPEPAHVPDHASAPPLEVPVIEVSSARPVEAPPSPAPPLPVAAADFPVVTSLPSLSDAFAALLAAEAHAGSRAAPLTWPTALPAAVVSDDVIEAVARRVLERLSDRVVREVVAVTVSRVAEQMVLEEIERIKANLKSAHPQRRLRDAAEFSYTIGRWRCPKNLLSTGWKRSGLRAGKSPASSGSTGRRHAIRFTGSTRLRPPSGPRSTSATSSTTLTP